MINPYKIEMEKVEVNMPNLLTAFGIKYSYGVMIRDWKPIIEPVVTEGSRYIRIPYWWSWTIWQSIKAFLFGEMSLIENIYK